MKTPATALLDSRRVSYRLHSYPHQDGQAYGPEAAKALGVDPARVFKTLVTEVGGALTVTVLPVAGTLDLKALAASAGAKRAKMAEVSAAERATGYVAGGISPLGQRKRLPVVRRRQRVGVRHHLPRRRPARPRDRAVPGRPDLPHRGQTGADRCRLIHAVSRGERRGELGRSNYSAVPGLPERRIAAQ